MLPRQFAIHSKKEKEPEKNKQNILRHDMFRPAPYQNQNNYDIRVVILRHAERIDHLLGSDWYQKIFNGVPSASPPAYQNSVLPQRLPQRQETFLYIMDPPISRNGEQQAKSKGYQLAQVGVAPDYCYSSPASRSMLTAAALLKGMNRSQVPIRVDPYLFEPIIWNSGLAILDQRSAFLSRQDWQQTGYNIDQNYQRLENKINAKETERDYCDRSAKFFDSIIHHHEKNIGKAPRRRITILIVAHASSTEMFPTIALGQPFDTRLLTEQTKKVPYLHTAVLERDATTHRWAVRPFLP